MLDQKFIRTRRTVAPVRATLLVGHGETEGSFAMTNVAGIVSILFIAAALWTSVGGAPKEQAVLILSSGE